MCLERLALLTCTSACLFCLLSVKFSALKTKDRTGREKLAGLMSAYSLLHKIEKSVFEAKNLDTC